MCFRVNNVIGDTLRLSKFSGRIVLNISEPWQLRMFRKTLKKKMRLKHLVMHIGNLSESDKCLLVTCGDNNGAMNYHLRNLGGQWSWADLEEKSIREMEELLGDTVHKVKSDKLPFDDKQFDCVVAIDVHEHLENPYIFTRELRRVAKNDAKVIVTVPNGDERKIATRIKNSIGMTKEKYGHVVEGYDLPELRSILTKSGIEPYLESSFSKFFTEMLELSINFLYVIVFFEMLYGLYIMYLGFATPLLETPTDKVVGYFVVTAVIALVIWFVLGAILSALFAFGGAFRMF